jgi:rubredoxin
MLRSRLVCINFPGGIIAPGYLLKLLEILETIKLPEISFGNRQQLLIRMSRQQLVLFSSLCREQQIAFSTGKTVTENIVSSYAAAGIFIHDRWLSEGVYKDVFDLFDYAPRLKINICDSQQTFVPLFTGHINWVASDNLHYWHLYVRLPKSNSLLHWPHLVYTNDLCSISKAIEKIILDFPLSISGNETVLSSLVAKVREQRPYISKPADKDLVLPRFHLPYYEGFNPYGNGYWLGIYRRDEQFSVSFLKDLCTISLQTRIGELYATPWKSIIIKGIEKGQRQLWDYVLGKHRINVRHAANELSWLIEDNSEDGLILKRHVIRYFDKMDVRTYGLCFSVKVKSLTGMFGSVTIRRKEIKNPGRLKYMERYSILYTRSFNPNSSDLILFRDDVQKEHLGPYLVALCKQFYEAANAPEILNQPVPQQLPPPLPQSKPVHQCRHCLTVYDQEAGDVEQGVAPGTSFNGLPDTYTCFLCEAPLSDFVGVEESMMLSKAV